MLVAEQSGIDVQCEPVATRGDRLMLMRTVYVGGGYRVELFNLFETDEAGEHLVRTVAFEPEQEDAAYAELDRRSLELGDLGVLFPISVVAAYDDGNRERLRECFAPDAVIVDHRPAQFGTQGVEEFVERTSSLYTLTASTRSRVIEIPIASGSASVSRVRTTGTTPDGGVFESERWSVGIARDGRVERLELFSANAAPRPRPVSRSSLVDTTDRPRTPRLGTSSNGAMPSIGETWTQSGRSTRRMWSPSIVAAWWAR